MPTRRRDPVSVPRTFYSSSRPSYSHDYAIDDTISRAGIFSNAVLEDTEAAASRSRGKDYDLLRNTHSAIIDTDLYSSPRASVASRKARATSVPPKVQARPVRLHQQLANRHKVVGNSQGISTVMYQPIPPVASNFNVIESQQGVHEVPWRVRAGSVDPRPIRAGSMPPVRISNYEPVVREPPVFSPHLGTESLRAHRNVPRRNRAGSLPPQRPRSIHVSEARRVSVQPTEAMGYFHGNNRGVGTEGLRAHRPMQLSRSSRAQSVIDLKPKPLDFGMYDELDKKPAVVVARRNQGNTRTARGISSRASSEPRQFIAPSESYPKIGDIEVKSQRRLYARRGQATPRQNTFVPLASNNAQAGIYSTQPVQSTYLHASKPSAMPKENYRKPIRTVDGFTKPKNVMSWEHRVESRLSPDDLMYQPSSFGRVREQMRNAREKLDRHRQMLDRRSNTDRSITSNNKATSPNSSVKIPDYYYAGTDPNNAPMSDLRRRLRRTLATTRNNPKE